MFVSFLWFLSCLCLCIGDCDCDFMILPLLSSVFFLYFLYFCCLCSFLLLSFFLVFGFVSVSGATFFSLVVVKLFIVFFFLSAFLGFLACFLVLLPLLLFLLLFDMQLAIPHLAVCLFFSEDCPFPVLSL